MFALFKAKGIVTSFEDVAMMGNAVKQGSGHFGVAKDLHPFCKGEIGRHNQRGCFVEFADCWRGCFIPIQEVSGCMERI
jgi:hypothetical protein